MGQIEIGLASHHCARLERLLGLYREIHKKYPTYGRIEVEDGVIEWEQSKVTITIRN